MSHSPEHQRVHTKMVKQIFKTVVRQGNLPYQQFRLFVDNDPDCTEWFWTTFYSEFPDSPYHYVAFCHTCRRFELYETEAEMLSDDPHG
ncbi:hypothetical protein [Symbiopectobacterium purcellii]|uniref:hypothetical protein n=1 Tax=Symbiopectobacterium purcellii TaxID=2871826 RepID=UPI003F84FFBF